MEVWAGWACVAGGWGKGGAEGSSLKTTNGCLRRWLAAAGVLGGTTHISHNQENRTNATVCFTPEASMPEGVGRLCLFMLSLSFGGIRFMCNKREDDDVWFYLFYWLTVNATEHLTETSTRYKVEFMVSEITKINSGFFAAMMYVAMVTAHIIWLETGQVWDKR